MGLCPHASTPKACHATLVPIKDRHIRMARRERQRSHNGTETYQIEIQRIFKQINTPYDVLMIQQAKE